MRTLHFWYLSWNFPGNWLGEVTGVYYTNQKPIFLDANENQQWRHRSTFFLKRRFLESFKVAACLKPYILRSQFRMPNTEVGL